MSVLETVGILGGERVLGPVRSDVEFVQMIEHGLPVNVVAEIARLGDLSESDLAEVIPRRTLQHARARGRLSAEQSDRMVCTARVYALAHRTFANPNKANHWMKRPKRALGGRAPLAMLRTSSGAQLVETLLDRITYGVYS